MILTSIGPDAPFHRAFTPRWAHAPESGAGAALAGGRFNRPGAEARYLAATPETALAECPGESPLLPPAMLGSGKLSCYTLGTTSVKHDVNCQTACQVDEAAMGKKMKSAPVYFALSQVQHNPLLNLGAYLPAIQERMRKAGYPDFKRAMQVQFDLAPAIAARETEQASQPAVQMVERFLFADVPSTSGFVLQANSLSFQTTEYQTFELFMGQLKLGMEILGEAVGGLSFTERLGLRYLDAVVPGAGETLGQYLAIEVLGLPARMSKAKFAYSFAEAVLLVEGGGQVVSRTVVQNGGLGFPPDLHPENLKVADRFRAISGEHAIIDTDGSFTGRQPFDMAQLESRFTALHGLIDESFRATATDYARKAWGAPEE